MNQAIYTLIGLGGIILSRATMDDNRASLCNSKLSSTSGHMLRWVAATEPADIVLTAGQKAAITRRERMAA